MPAGTTLAIFTDADPAGTPADYTATINWGDGTPTVTLPAAAITQPGGPGTAFLVKAGGHVFVEEGQSTFTVTITDNNASVTLAGTAYVADSPPTAGAAQPTVLLTEGQAFSGPVASFTELYSNATQTNPETASDFTATIDWGDGSPNSVGVVVATATPGLYQVLGTHVYAQSGVNVGPRASWWGPSRSPSRYTTTAGRSSSSPTRPTSATWRSHSRASSTPRATPASSTTTASRTTPRQPSLARPNQVRSSACSPRRWAAGRGP